MLPLQGARPMAPGDGGQDLSDTASSSDSEDEWEGHGTSKKKWGGGSKATES